jgi:hypothetical protein
MHRFHWASLGGSHVREQGGREVDFLAPTNHINYIDVSRRRACARIACLRCSILRRGSKEPIFAAGAQLQAKSAREFGMARICKTLAGRLAFEQHRDRTFCSILPGIQS